MLTRIAHIENCRRLILIFAGWSTTPALYRDVMRRGWDVAVVHDYDSFSFSDEELTLLESFDTIWLYAWSLGVAAAEAMFSNHPELRIAAAYAVNGSTNPVDDSEGIPVTIFEGTMQNLSQSNLLKFRKRMAGDSATFKAYFNTEFDDARIEQLKAQLQLFMNYQPSGTTSIPWRRSYIGDADRIFPPENLARNWQRHNVETVTTAQAHFISIASIVDRTLQDTEVVGQKFKSALPTYDLHAQAQKIIADRLAGLIISNSPAKVSRILEIGQGSGILTRKYAPVLKPSAIDFVDISETPVFNVAPVENYFCQDAEEWASQSNERYDLIVSASTVQWFSDLEVFIKNCRRLLNPGGSMFFSTFLPGNLQELDTLRPTPIHYHSKEDVVKFCSRHLSLDFTEEEDIKLNFQSPRDLLMHLRYTGVAGSGNNSSLSRKLSSLPSSLTYRALYVKLTRMSDISE